MSTFSHGKSCPSKFLHHNKPQDYSSHSDSKHFNSRQPPYSKPPLLNLPVTHSPTLIHTLPILTPPIITPLSLAPTLYLGVTFAQSLALSVTVLAIMPITALPLPLCHTPSATLPHLQPHPPKINPFQSPEPMPDQSGRLNLTIYYLPQPYTYSFLL